MTSKVIVLIADAADSKYGEVAVLESTAEAERLIETFLESGYDPERIRAFAGTEIEARVSHRPRVDLVRQEPDPAALAEDTSAVEEIEPATMGKEDVERSGAESETGAPTAHDVRAGRMTKGMKRLKALACRSSVASRSSRLNLMPELLH